MKYALNVIYLGLLAAASPWLLFAAFAHGKYRQGWGCKFLGRVPRPLSQRPCIWLHAVSVGEVNLLQPILTRLANQYPGHECLISTTTKTGFELARRKYSEHVVFYCPLDFSWAVAEAMRRIRPELLVLAELELWPNLITAARRCGAKVAIFNGRLSDRSWRGYRRVKPLLRPLLKSLDAICVQNEVYAQRFVDLGARPESVHVTGSVKFDGAEWDRQNAKTRRLRQLAGFSSHDIIFLAGSTQAPEEQCALETFQELQKKHPRLKLIIAPRHPERFEEVAEILQHGGATWRRRTELTSPENPAASNAPSILLVDVVGELGAWWGAADVGFVGGSMGNRGGQNMIEPAAYGVATCFGPNTRNFRDIVSLLLAANGAVVVPDPAELTEFVGRCLREPAFAENLGRRARHLVLQQRGAADQTLQVLAALLQGGESKQQAA